MLFGHCQHLFTNQFVLGSIGNPDIDGTTDAWVFVGPVCDSLTDELWVWYGQWGIIIGLYQGLANADFFKKSTDLIDLKNVS